jgi:hypothetical protein
MNKSYLLLSFLGVFILFIFVIFIIRIYNIENFENPNQEPKEETKEKVKEEPKEEVKEETKEEVKEEPEKMVEISPVIQIAEQTSKLEVLRKEYQEVEREKLKREDEIRNNVNELIKLNNEISERKKEKLELDKQIADINATREEVVMSANVIKQGLEAQKQMENKLDKKENEINTLIDDYEKKKEIDELITDKPTEIKPEQIDMILDKLDAVKREMISYNSNKVCKEFNKMPEVTDKSFMINTADIKIDSDNKDHQAYLWCMCDDNKDKDECITYMDCNKNYNKNNGKAIIDDDDLTLYNKCISKYPSFPNYRDNSK